MKNYFRIEVFKQTKDNWYPSYHIKDDVRYPQGFVSISFFPLNTTPVMYRVSVWGQDDCGMDRDFISKTTARNMFMKLCLLDWITKKELEQEGFNYF